MNQQVTTIHGLEAVEIGCNLGHDAPPIHLWDKDEFGYYRCPECGLVWVNPQLTDESVAHIYAKGFTSKLKSKPHPTNFLAYRRPLKRLAPYRQYSRLLDVGCFTGHFLLAAREAGWQQVEGTEISSQAIEYAREQYHLTLHEGDLLSLDLPSDAFDAVTLFDVIEHVSDPLGTLRRVYQLLRPGGVLYLDTPHFTSLPRFLFNKEWSVFFPWHRTYFSANNMSLALEQCGFRVRDLRAVGIFPLSRFNAWQSYQAADAIRAAPAPQKHTWIRQHRNTLRPYWLGFKRMTELPFEALSRVGIHIGAKLVVYAEKPD